MTHPDKKRISLAAVGLLAFSLLGFLLIWQVAEKQKSRDLAVWENQLNMIAASRADAVSAWLNRHMEALKTLSSDASLQIYTSELAANSDLAEAQLGFIRNLLGATAQRTGFHESRPLDQIQANVRASDRAGLALAFSDGTVMTASSGMPVIAMPVEAMKSGRHFITLGPVLSDRTPLIIFGAPVGTLEGIAAGTSKQAWVIGARAMDSDFLDLMRQPGVDHRTGQTYLVQAVPGTDAVTILTPVTFGARAPQTLKSPAAAAAISHPGKAHILPGELGDEVMVTGHDLTAPVNWVLVRSIEADEALAAVNYRRSELFFTLSAAAIAIALVIYLAWKLGVSRKLTSALAEAGRLSKQNEHLSEFLLSVSNSQPTAIAAIDEQMTIRHANDRLGEMTGASGHALIERPLATAFFGEDNERICQAAEKAIAGESSSFLRQMTATGKWYQVDCIPLKTDGAEATTTAKALIVMQNVSELVAAREEKEAFFERLLSTLTMIIDARDPWSKQHSQRLARVAGALAQAMKLDEAVVATTVTAAHLMNLGKILVPRSVLTKQAPLDRSELTLVRESIMEGGALLDDLPFEGPVADTIKQAQAHWDGSGLPADIAGEDILLPARILSVANAFVALVSARAHRESMAFDKAVDILSEEAGKRFDKSVISALAYVLDHAGGRTEWADFAENAAVAD